MEIYWVSWKRLKNIFSKGIRVLFQNLRRGRTFWASVGNQLLRDGKKSQFDFVSILSVGAEQGPAASLHNRRGGRWGLLRLNPSHATHAPSVQPSLVRHLTQPPCFLLACPKFTWTVEVSGGRQACKRTYGRLRKRKSRMLPLSVCSLPVFPTSYAMKASIEACFALFFFVCADMPHPGISVGRQPSRSDDLNWHVPCLCVILFTWRGWVALHGVPFGLKRFLLLVLLI